MLGLLGWFMGMAVGATMLFGVIAVGDAAIDDARAATAADAAALAGAAGGVEAAQAAASRNGAVLVAISVSGAVTTVEVRVDRAAASAHAERMEIVE